MKPLVVTSAMTSMSGVFYPTGHVFALFKDEASVRNAIDALQKAQHQGTLAHADPARIRSEITQTIESNDDTLPSAGADSDIVRRIDDLATEGRHGLLIELTDKDDVDTVQAALEATGAEAAFYYRTFIIEELVEQPIDPSEPSVRVGTHVSGNKH